MRFEEYDKWFWEQTNGIALGEGSIQIGPYVTPTVTPNKPPWKLEWTVLFEDGFYLRLKEYWYRRSASFGGSGTRQSFSFHYGPTNPSKDVEGVPIYSEGYPATIRIDQDVDWRGPHLHYKGEDHVSQTRVQNLRISDVEPFEFIRAVLEHRKTGQSFETIMRFVVTN
jgi:hypothetical protein